jgi:hypothetical protein
VWEAIQGYEIFYLYGDIREEAQELCENIFAWWDVPVPPVI